MNRETMAYLYQLREDLLPFISEEGSVSFFETSLKKEIKKLKKNESDVSHLSKCTHAVEVHVEEEGQTIKIKGFGVSFEDAAKKAKEEAVKLLLQITEKAMSSEEHLNQINAILNKETLIH